MESRFGRRFGDVRIHDDGEAADAARGAQARAYTIGSDVVFGAGQYQPATAAGRRLIAHELTHVVQQRSAAGGRSTADGARTEREARDVSVIVASGGRGAVRHGAPLVAQRQSAEGEADDWTPPSPDAEVEPELGGMLRRYTRWYMGTMLVEGDAPTQLPGVGGAGSSLFLPLQPDFFAPLPPDPLWVPPDWGSLYGAHLERGVPVDERDSDLLFELYRERLRLAQSLPDFRAMAPKIIRPLIPSTWRRDIAGALTSAAAGSGLKRDFLTPIDVSDRAWQNMTGAGTTVIPLPSISFDLL
jgi:hypothetical protein